MVKRRNPYAGPIRMLGYASLLALALMMVLPFIWMISTSLKTSSRSECVRPGLTTARAYLAVPSLQSGHRRSPAPERWPSG